jgi:hypothetical protein
MLGFQPEADPIQSADRPLGKIRASGVGGTPAGSPIGGGWYEPGCWNGVKACWAVWYGVLGGYPWGNAFMFWY